nr:diaminobutyrate acetyltransferase [Anianabacter salinae]
MKTDGITFREPTHEDGAAIHELIASCPPLDTNSLYCNLVQCDHFAETCVVAELEGKIVGWISGHLVPNEDAVFVWQVAVGEDARGRGLGYRMLRNLLQRDACKDVTAMKTTITADNAASWALFTRFADRVGAELDSDPHYTRDEHFRGAHATEHMLTIKLAAPLKAVA